MKHMFCFVFCTLLLWQSAFAETQPRETMLLNGTWQFEQTITAFPPAKFTRTIPVPGLIHLADLKLITIIGYTLSISKATVISRRCINVGGGITEPVFNIQPPVLLY